MRGLVCAVLGMATLVVFERMGAVLAAKAGLGLPSGVVGFVLLALVLGVCRKVPRGLLKSAGWLLSHLPLFLMPTLFAAVVAFKLDRSLWLFFGLSCVAGTWHPLGALHRWCCGFSAGGRELGMIEFVLLNVLVVACYGVARQGFAWSGRHVLGLPLVSGTALLLAVVALLPLSSQLLLAQTSGLRYLMDLAVVATGLTGALCIPWVMRLYRLEPGPVHAFTLGACAHAIGLVRVQADSPQWQHFAIAGMWQCIVDGLTDGGLVVSVSLELHGGRVRIRYHPGQA